MSWNLVSLGRSRVALLIIGPLCLAFVRPSVKRSKGTLRLAPAAAGAIRLTSLGQDMPPNTSFNMSTDGSFIAFLKMSKGMSTKPAVLLGIVYASTTARYETTCLYMPESTTFGERICGV